MQYPKSVSYFTVVMDRLHHLKQTLPVNLKNSPQQNTSFVILDYGSSDGLCAYVQEHFANEIASGKVQLYRVRDVKYFNRCQSRNLAARLTAADFICNLDADNFTGEGFSDYLFNLFEQKKNAFVSGLNNPSNKGDAFGKLAVSRETFLEVGGFDESFEGYGFEDYDLVNRLKTHGLEEVIISDPEYLQTVTHAKEQSVVNEWVALNLKAIYTQQVTRIMRAMLFLFKDQSLHYGIVTENPHAQEEGCYRFALVGKGWQKGTWQASERQLRLEFADFECMLNVEQEGDEELLSGYNHRLKLVTDRKQIKEAIVFNTEIANRYRWRANAERKVVKVNIGRPGTITVEEVSQGRKIMM